MAKAEDELQAPIRLRRATDRTPLGRIVGEIEVALAAGNYQLVNTLIEANPVAVWYGITPDRLTGILDTLARSGEEVNIFVRLLSMMLAPNDAGGPQDVEDTLASPEWATMPSSASLLLRLMMFRLQGDSADALRAAQEFDDEFGAIRPIFDADRGFSLISPVQLGITAMLAGDFDVALASFTRAQMHVLVPALAFLSRDAYAKAAMVHALYGDRSRARTLLDEAARLPRTESWAEPLIDACVIIAESMLHDRPEDALASLERVPLRDVGEMWPFFAEAEIETLIKAGRISDAQRRVEVFESLPLPRRAGQGFSGSVLPIQSALIALVNGDLISARNQIERADREVPLTRLILGIIELAAGRPNEALVNVGRLYEQMQGLRLQNLWRIAVSAGSQMALGAEEDCADLIEYALEAPGGLQPEEALYFPSEVRSFAESRFGGWPQVPVGGAAGLFDRLSMNTGVLTARETELLRELATGLPREHIAKSLFISLNTLKAHLRSIYRKLGVNSRIGAVIEAERRGLI